MSEISKNILDQIREEKIKPRPRWQFVLINLLLIIILITCVAFGGLVMSLVFLKLFNLEWQFVTWTGERGLPHLLDVLPLLWIGLLLLVLGLSVLVFEKTEGGYKYHPVWIVVGSIFVSTILGALLYNTCINGTCGADAFEALLQERLPSYAAMEMAREEKFLRPEQGILPARLIEVLSSKEMRVEDLREKIWRVELMPNSGGRQNILKLKEGQFLIIVGEVNGPDQFFAREIRLKRAPVLKVKQRVQRFLESK